MWLLVPAGIGVWENLSYWAGSPGPLPSKLRLQRLNLDDMILNVPMVLYVYRLMVCNFLFDNLDQVYRIYKQGGVAKKQPAGCPLPLGLSSLCEQGLSMYGHSGRVAISRWSKV